MGDLVRLASQHAKTTSTDTGNETLAEFNRLLRARILPRVTPRVSGYDICASTLAPRQGAGCTSWDWFVLRDGRPAFCVLKAQQSDVFSAQRLASVRLLLRSSAGEPQVSLGAMLTRVNRGLRTGWVEGLSGPVAIGMVALADGAAEWVAAGAITAMVARSRGYAEELDTAAPPLGDDADHDYESMLVVLDSRDRVLALTGSHDNARKVVEAVLVHGYVSNSRDALAKLLGGLEPSPVEGEDPSDVSATVVTRTKAPVGG